MEKKVRFGDLNLVFLEGTNAERARQYGQLMHDEIHNGPLEALAKKNIGLIKTAGGALDFKPLQALAINLYNKLLVPLMAMDLPQREKLMMEELARASGYPLTKIRQAFYQADGLMLLSRTSIMQHLFKDLAARNLPGCSSAAVRREWTKNGKMLVSRNQDYPIVGPWEKHTTVAFNKPTEAGEYAYTSVTSAGLFTGGLTTMNEHGITVAAHAHFGKDVRFRGNPIFVVGEQIASKAKNLDEAIALAEKFPRKANWTLVVTSGHENDAITLELSPRHFEVRRMEDGFINHTNFFHNEKMKEKEALISGGRFDDDWARFCRMRQYCKEHKGELTPGHMARMLGDHTDPWTDEQRIFQNTLSVMSTVKSVVFSPEENCLYVSNREKSPVGLGDFVKLDVEKLWNGEIPSTPEYLEKPGPAHDEKFIQQVDQYREAYRAWQMEYDDPNFRERTLEALEKTCAMGPEDAHVYIQTAAVAFKLGDFDKARRYLNLCLGKKLSPAMQATHDLFAARLLDLEKRREQALEIYRRLLGSGFPPAEKAARQGLRRSYHHREKGRLMIDMQYGDPVAY